MFWFLKKKVGGKRNISGDGLTAKANCAKWVRDSLTSGQFLGIDFDLKA